MWALWASFHKHTGAIGVGCDSSTTSMFRSSSSTLWCYSQRGADAYDATGRKKVNCSCANPFLFLWDNSEDRLGKLLISLEALLHVATGLGCVHSLCSAYFYSQTGRREGDAAARSVQRWYLAVWLVSLYQLLITFPITCSRGRLSYDF